MVNKKKYSRYFSSSASCSLGNVLSDMKRKVFPFKVEEPFTIFTRFFGLVSLAFLLIVGNSWAQTSDDTHSFDEIEVRGQGLSSELESTSATILTNRDLVNKIYVTPLDLLTQTPGLSVDQYGESGTAAAFKLRGYTGSHGSGVAIFLDGIPLNETDGYADNNIIIPIEIDRVEIIKGPASALYGNYASGGVVSYYTIKSGNFTRLRLNAGSFKTLDASGIIARSSDKLDQVYAFQIYHTDGYRHYSNWDKQNIAARYTYHFTEKLTATLGLRAFNSNWDSAGYIPSFLDRRDYVHDNTGDGNGGDKKRFEARIDVNYKINDEIMLMFYTWGNDQDFTRFYINYIYNPTPTSSTGNERFHQRHVWGTGTSFNFDGIINGKKLIFVTGIDFMRESENRERWNMVYGYGRSRQGKIADLKYTINTFSVYSEANYQILQPLMVRAGVRYDNFTGNLLNRNQNRRDKSKGFSTFSPKLGVLYTPIQQIELFANYGKGFQLPSVEGAFFTSDTQTFAEREQYEVGIRTNPLDWFSFGILYYHLNSKNDVIVNPATLESENIGKTLRTGIETYVDFFPWDGWTFHIDYTYQTATYKEQFINIGTTANPIYVSQANYRITGIPRHISHFQITYEPELGLGGWIRFNWYADRVGRDQPGAETFWTQDYGSLDLQLNYRISERYMLTFDVQNALNKDYYGSQNTANADGIFTFSPRNPLAIYLGFNVNFE
ncbi:MAG: TonB-dependent receptor [Deltaproteobacteria bacterium]|jgi:iron complex outermembrane receptor protein|nr:TonB-dependent receptor [Deltaproteobacteria bacterium]